jgi:dihydrodipicolinate reductase
MPSGTAISLANGIINSAYESWTLEEPITKQIQIEAKRVGTVPGHIQ